MRTYDHDKKLSKNENDIQLVANVHCPTWLWGSMIVSLRNEEQKWCEKYIETILEVGCVSYQNLSTIGAKLFEIFKFRQINLTSLYNKDKRRRLRE